MTVLFNSNGYIVNSAIDGFIQMKSYLLGNPELRLAFNDDLVVGRVSVLYIYIYIFIYLFIECELSDKCSDFR